MGERTSVEVAGKRVAVIGLGRSGIAAVRLLGELGARVAVADQKPLAELAATLEGLRAGELEVHSGGAYEPALRGADLVVVSPGVPLTLEPLRRARAAGVRVIGELELAARCLTGKLIAVTGTNGKSTTVTWIGEVLQRAGYEPFVGGNLGTPLAEAAYAALHGRRWDFVVVEVSSFQLETIETFHPWIGAILNVTPDHLDRYPSMEAYAAAKLRMFENQTAKDYAVLNADDPRLARAADGFSGTRVLFSRSAVVMPYDGVPTLMFRAANQRHNQILEAQIRLTLARDETTSEGHRMRRFQDLQLARNRSPLFALTWTVMHPIGPNSPLHGLSQADLRDQAAEIIITLTGIDETFSQTIHARHSFVADDIHWDRRLADILTTMPDGRRAVDYAKFHDIVPD